MAKFIKKIFAWSGKLRIEEKLLFGIFLLFFGVFLLIKPSDLDLPTFAQLQLSAFKNSFIWFLGSAAILWTYFMCLYVVKFMIKMAFCQNSKTRELELLKLREFFFDSLSYLRFFFFLMLGFSGNLLILYVITQSGHQRMVNEMLMGWDKTVFGVYPFIWFHDVHNLLKPALDYLTPAIWFSFDKLSLIMAVSIMFLFRYKKIFAGLIISYFIALIVSLFIWNIFPVNSPNNYYLSQNPQIEGYSPNGLVQEYEAKVRENQKDTLPISTFPSAHVMWGLETAYFWSLYSKKTLFISVPWFLLMALGTVYLAQHWAVDVLAAIPIAVISIAVTKFITRKVSDN